MNVEKETLLRELVEQQYTQKDISKLMGVCEDTVRRWCKKLDLKSKGNFSKRKDLTGKRSGNILFLTPCGKSVSRFILWDCVCSCGNKIIIPSNKFGKVVNCGKCSKVYINGKTITSSKSKTRIYRLWSSMRGRCNYTSVNSYSRYGGRGIAVCTEWEDFDIFYNWAIANGYNDNLTLDRLNIDGDYIPSNCRWVSLKEQMRNKSNNVFIEFHQEVRCLSEWSEITGIRADTLRRRINNLGWSVEKALTTPVAPRNKK